jgi:ribosome-binding factor A
MKRQKSSGATGASNRQLRVGENVRHALAEILARETLFDSALTGVLITIPQVRMSPDLKLATAYVMPLGGKAIDAVVTALERHKKFLRGELAKRLDMRSVPDLRFRADDSFDQGMRMDALLASPEVTRDTAKTLKDDR